MIEASKLRAGMTFVTNDGKLIKVLEASHHKPGKGNTIMRMKLRDVRSGSTFDTSYRPEEKFEQAIIETVPAQYLYQMDDTAYFMNTETYDQYEIPVANVQEELKFILENSEVKIQFYGTEVIGVQVPTTVELTVTETQPSIKVQQLQVQVNLQHLKLVLWLTFQTLSKLVKNWLSTQLKVLTYHVPKPD